MAEPREGCERWREANQAVTQPSAKERLILHHHPINQHGWEFMGLPETLKGVRLGGCRFTARGGKRS